MKIHSQSLIIYFSFLAKSSDPPRRKETMRFGGIIYIIKWNIVILEKNICDFITCMELADFGLGI